MRLFKRIIPALLIVLCCAGIVSAVGPELTAETAVLIDAETGQVLYDKNMHQQMLELFRREQEFLQLMTNLHRHLKLSFRKKQPVLMI